MGWIGVGALGCMAGIAITGAAFLLLPGPADTANVSFKSHVAGFIATPPSGTRADGVRTPDLQTTAAEEKAEIPKPARWSSTATSSVEPADAEPAPEPAPGAALARGEAAGPAESTHVVQEGETLWGIAADNGIEAADLAARNGLPEDALVMTGDVLVIPASTTPQ